MLRRAAGVFTLLRTRLRRDRGFVEYCKVRDSATKYRFAVNGEADGVGDEGGCRMADCSRRLCGLKQIRAALRSESSAATTERALMDSVRKRAWRGVWHDTPDNPQAHGRAGQKWQIRRVQGKGALWDTKWLSSTNARAASASRFWHRGRDASCASWRAPNANAARIMPTVWPLPGRSALYRWRASHTASDGEHRPRSDIDRDDSLYSVPCCFRASKTWTISVFSLFEGPTILLGRRPDSVGRGNYSISTGAGRNAMRRLL